MANELSAEQVRKRNDPSVFKCNSTEELEPIEGIIGQDRALSALKFGLNIPKLGFNIFVSGPAGTGRTTAIKSFLETLAAKKETPPDWCYVHNFRDSYCPRALKMPAGMGQGIQKDLKRTIDNVHRSIAQAFTSKEYFDRRSELTESLNKKKRAVFHALNKKAIDNGLLLQTTPVGLVLIPASNGEPMTAEEYTKLSATDKEELEERRMGLATEVQEQNAKVKTEERNVQKQLEDIDRDVANYSISPLFGELHNKYNQLPQVIDYLNEVEQDVIENFEQFRAEPSVSDSDVSAAIQEVVRKQSFRKYEVNVLVDNSELQRAPVILELNPTFNNLLGRIEKEAQFGALFTDFTMIKGGSLHQANGGYFVVRVEDILTNFQSWDGLKRTLRDGKLVIEELGERLGSLATKSLKPEPIPLDIKVVVIGEPLFYYLLWRLDLEFKELFKVKADFDTRMDNTEVNLKNYTSVICRLCTEENLKHLTSPALAKITEHSSRLAGDQEKLSTLFADIADIIREANFWAGEEGTSLIEARHVEKTIEEKVYRSNLIQHRINEMIDKGMIIIDTAGENIGQVNGLEVIDLGDFSFGKPTRITASVGVGREGLIDIERESKLGGRLHTKGVMILSGYITQKYVRDIPLSLSARLVFEQSYQEIEGDSASSTELYALFSRLTDVPIKQAIAVTGSVNQKGEVQAIGGLNEKIEGFFEVCKAKGLNGQQGVLIPASNARNLMLKEEVVEAVESGNFHIYPVSTIDEGIEVLTGLKAGQLLEDGSFEPNSINDRVQKRLATLAEKLRDFTKGEEKTPQ
ncbi:MAG TPA: AAA family ATPase [Dehalococcoidia bacterium]|jgi:lon-related putative ATP-dependent protease|nr:AAA family ATPase [Dehalococcoidia bacterium]